MRARPQNATGAGDLIHARGDLAALSEVVAATAALAHSARNQAAHVLLLRAYGLLRDLAAATRDGADQGRHGGFTPS